MCLITARHVVQSMLVGLLNAALAMGSGLALAAGAENSATAPQASPPVAQQGTVAREERRKLQRPRIPEAAPVPGSVEGQAEDVRLPAFIRARVLADAEQRAGKASGTARLKRAQAVTWPDGSLGCPEPGREYPQLPVAGYHALVEVDGRNYDYRVPTAARADVAGTAIQMRLCESASGIRAAEPGQTPSKPPTR